MKNKIASLIVLTLLICVCISPLPCAAAGSAQISLEEKTAEPGDEVILLLDISDNPGISALSLTFSYDQEALTLSKDGQKSNGDIFPTLDIARNFFFSADGDCKGNGTLAKLIFTVSPTAKSGVYPITFGVNECYSFDDKTLTFTSPAVTKVGGSITIKGGADVTEAPSVADNTTAAVTTAAPASTVVAPATTAKVTTAKPVTTVPATTAAPVTVAPVTTVLPVTTEAPDTVIPVTTALVTTVLPAVTEDKPVTEPAVMPVETAPTVTSIENPVASEPVATEAVPEQTQAQPSVTPTTPPLSGDTQADKGLSPLLIVAGACVAVAIALIAVVIFLIKRKK